MFNFLLLFLDNHPVVHCLSHIYTNTFEKSFFLSPQQHQIWKCICVFLNIPTIKCVLKYIRYHKKENMFKLHFPKKLKNCEQKNITNIRTGWWFLLFILSLLYTASCEFYIRILSVNYHHHKCPSSLSFIFFV